jgi:hypothetical protein
MTLLLLIRFWGNHDYIPLQPIIAAQKWVVNIYVGFIYFTYFYIKILCNFSILAGQAVLLLPPVIKTYGTAMPRKNHFGEEYYGDEAFVQMAEGFQSSILFALH